MWKYVTSICSHKETSQGSANPHNNNTPVNQPRRRRIAFTLDRVLVKESRRNFIAKKNNSTAMFCTQIEEHLVDRISDQTVVEFSGPFSDSIFKAVPFGFRTFKSHR